MSWREKLDHANWSIGGLRLDVEPRKTTGRTRSQRSNTIETKRPKHPTPFSDANEFSCMTVSKSYSSVSRLLICLRSTVPATCCYALHDFRPSELKIAEVSYRSAMCIFLGGELAETKFLMEASEHLLRRVVKLIKCF